MLKSFPSENILTNCALSIECVGNRRKKMCVETICPLEKCRKKLCFVNRLDRVMYREK